MWLCKGVLIEKRELKKEVRQRYSKAAVLEEIFYESNEDFKA